MAWAVVLVFENNSHHDLLELIVSKKTIFKIHSESAQIFPMKSSCFALFMIGASLGAPGQAQTFLADLGVHSRPMESAHSDAAGADLPPATGPSNQERQGGADLAQLSATDFLFHPSDVIKNPGWRVDADLTAALVQISPHHGVGDFRADLADSGHHSPGEHDVDQMHHVDHSSAIPEPATSVACLGLLTLAMAFLRRFSGVVART